MSSLLISDIFKNVQFTFGNVAIMATAAVTLGLIGHSLLVKSSQVIWANRRKSRESQVRF
jgi:hypothetical protein